MAGRHRLGGHEGPAGGIEGQESIKLAALAAYLGVNPLPILEEGDATKIVALRAALEKAEELKEKAEKALANKIIHELSKAVK